MATSLSNPKIEVVKSNSLLANDNYDQHEIVFYIEDLRSGLKSFIAIHSQKLGIAHGGTRLRRYNSEQEAMSDVLNLSKAMSYKSALAGLPYGGAKGVIIANDITNREEALIAYARAIDKLDGLFHTGTDSGLSDEDIIMMSNYTRYMLGTSNEKKSTSTSKAAALGVYYSIQEAAKKRFGTDDLKGRKVGIKGVGKLGGELISLLIKEDCLIYVSDIDASKIAKVTEKYPTLKVVSSQDLFAIDLDIYAPCAFGDEFDLQNIRNLKTKIIAGGANNQLANEEVGYALSRRNILYVPDYIANAGGLLFVSEDLEEGGFNTERLSNRLNNIRTTVRSVLDLSDELSEPTNNVATIIARKKIYG